MKRDQRRDDTRGTTATAASSHVAEIADLLALGYLRARKREAVRLARTRRVRTCSKALDDVAPDATFATGDSATSTEG